MRKNWLMNIGLAMVALAVLVWFAFIWMNWYTRHGDSIEVPNLKGVAYEDAVRKLEDAGLRYEIFDSVYSETVKKNAITEQDPPAQTQVKPDRVIYLTINALGKPKVKMPKLVDQSFTLSKAVLKNSGLTLGNVVYKFDEIGHNLVIEQLYHGQPILPGKMLEKGSVIDLVVATNRRSIVEPDSNQLNQEISNPEPDPAPIEQKPKPKSKKRRHSL